MLKKAISANKVFNVFRRALRSGKYSPERLAKFEKTIGKWAPNAAIRACDACDAGTRKVNFSDILRLFNRRTLRNIRKSMIQLAPPDRYTGNKATKVLPELVCNFDIDSACTTDLLGGRRVIFLPDLKGKIDIDAFLHEIGHTMRHMPDTNEINLKRLIEEVKATSLGSKLLKKLPEFYTEEGHKHYLASMRKAFESYKLHYLLTRIGDFKNRQILKL